MDMLLMLTNPAVFLVDAAALAKATLVGVQLAKPWIEARWPAGSRWHDPILMAAPAIVSVLIVLGATLVSGQHPAGDYLLAVLDGLLGGALSNAGYKLVAGTAKKGT